MLKSMLSIILVLTGASLAFAQNTTQDTGPSVRFTEKEVRFQIVKTDQYTTLMVDTQTGRTWRLVVAADEDRKAGVTLLWQEVMIMPLPKGYAEYSQVPGSVRQPSYEDLFKGQPEPSKTEAK
jgi:hypothetical protein